MRVEDSKERSGSGSYGSYRMGFICCALSPFLPSPLQVTPCKQAVQQVKNRKLGLAGGVRNGGCCKVFQTT